MKKIINHVKANKLVTILFLLITNKIAIADDLNIIGHRGAAGLIPENTLAGFKKAMELGVDTIELDIHLSSDNEAVVYHDSRLNPAITKDTHGKWVKEKHLIRELTLSEIQSYDVGKLNKKAEYAKKYPEQKAVEGERIPTLLDVVQLLKTNNKTHLFIEIKFSPLKSNETKSVEEISNVVAKIIKDENIAERVTVISFDWKTLMYFQKIMPEVPTGYVTRAKQGNDTIQKNKSGASPWMGGLDIDNFGSIPEAVKSAGGSYWIANYRHATGHKKYITTKLVEKAHSLGIKVILWTPDTKSDMKKLIKIGADGIVTNRPDILLSLVKR
ncbi:MAG: glycerophosphodiester phosphodiesterase [Deltaproteobacteria bacterium]|nr:glycerophosphodiester phosphodiesterase [Deltaproteobacteria bacterium]